MDYINTWQEVTNWLGNKVVNFDDKTTEISSEYFYRFVAKPDGEDIATTYFDEFLEIGTHSECEGVIMGFYGDWEMSYEGGDTHGPAVTLLTENSGKLPKLKHIYLGDGSAAHNYDISSCQGGQLDELLVAFPGLENLHARATDPGLKPTRHACLRSLVIEGSGVTNEFLLCLAEQSVFPELEQLTLCLGDSEYAGIGDDLSAVTKLINNNPFPKLKQLGLCNCGPADKLVELLTQSEMIQQIESLDLSLGTMGDAGGELLAKSEAFKNLKELELIHHYMTEPVIELVNKRFSGIKLKFEVGDAEPDYRYVGVTE